MYDIEAGQFSGPLDLLLHLIEREELDISAVSLAAVTDQYLARIHEIEKTSPDELADFLVIAARLLYLKAKALLPYLIIEPEEGADDLERQLRMYREFVRAAETIRGMIGAKRFMFVREKPPIGAVGFVPPKKLTANDMEALFREALERLRPFATHPAATIARTISIHEKIRDIQALLKNHEHLKFTAVLEHAADKTEIIVSFLALLELIRGKQVDYEQEDSFGEISLKRLEYVQS